MFAIGGGLAPAIAAAAEPIPIGSRLELMVDDYLIDKLAGASLVLHQPLKREVAINHDARQWDGWEPPRTQRRGRFPGQRCE
jgi:hypothetical protein